MVALGPERRRAVFALIVTACVVVALGYGGWAVQRTRANRGAAGSGAGEGTIGDDAAARALIGHAPTVMFRNEVMGEAWAQVALVPSATPAGPRAIVPLRCRRLHFSGGRGLCVAEDPGFGMGYDVSVFGSDFRILHKFPLIGLPSRARVSPDGRYGAVTVFVAGHSYSGGDFSTETTIFDLAQGTKLGTLEEFTAVRDGRPFKAVDFNFWGVTFAADGNRFYATLKTKGETYLVEGDIATRRVRVLRPNVECPSLSPDGTRIAFKKRVSGSLGAVTWRFHVLDLRTMIETPLAEERSIDDQIEWLDDRFVLYGVMADVWMVQADGSGEARRYLSRAVSPSVVRTAIDAPLPRNARTLTLPYADIGVAVSAATKVVPAGQDLPYTVTVTNHGPAPAHQIDVDIQLSPTVGVTSLAPVNSRTPYGCYHQEGYISCTVAQLQPEESWTLQLILKPFTTGLLRHRVTVSEAQPDPVPINNSATVKVNVVPSS
jgi:uncharacterized repeat protein (TIGR01451 family)